MLATEDGWPCNRICDKPKNQTDECDCGWVDQSEPALAERWTRLRGRPTLYLGECDVATRGGPQWLKKIGQYGKKATEGMEFMTTGFANHNDAWVLRNSTARAYLRRWLANVFRA